MDAPISSPAMAQRQLPSTTTTTTTTTTAQSFAPPPPAVPKTPSTDSFIRDLNLVAEAAKRAQMATEADPKTRLRNWNQEASEPPISTPSYAL
ncbi:hypothetical protein M434DRAFT_33119 [Hypoxylon sp. CO27-5]|nr:hypothetical protein M434DRAFT_33119 [Hypoxylon sp. CO27-5]